MVVMQASRSRSRRIAALFGLGALVVGRLWFEAIAERAIWARWPLVPLVLSGLLGLAAALIAVLASLTSYAQSPHAPAIRWGAAAAMLFVGLYLENHTARTHNGFVVGAVLLAACLCAWRAERLGRVAADLSLRDV